MIFTSLSDIIRTGRSFRSFVQVDYFLSGLQAITRFIIAVLSSVKAVKHFIISSIISSPPIYIISNIRYKVNSFSELN